MTEGRNGSSRSILVAEDDVSTAELERRVLTRATHQVRTSRRVDESLRLLSQERFCLAIVDLRLEDGDAWPVLAAARKLSPRVPVILVTALGDESVAAEAIHRGASEYVIKTASFWEDLPRMAERVVQVAALENENALLAAVVKHSEDGILAGSLSGEIRSWNPAAERIFGFRAEEIVGRSVSVLIPTEKAQEQASIMAMLRGEEQALHRETVRCRKDGTQVEVWESVSPIRGSTGEVTGAAIVIRDIREQKQLEAQLRQAQKLEAVGRLAGGIAHDFNNLMTVVTGYSELLMLSTDESDTRRRPMEEISIAADRARVLTRQLLAFSRRQVLHPKVLQVNEVTQGMSYMLGRLLGEDIELFLRLSPELGAIVADTGQIEQVLMNLAVNARDAMPEGGRLSIQTTNTEPHAFADGKPSPGSEVLLQVRDTGVGMSEEVKARIFEPFFTTKGQGKGTGLGLATAYGIVQQSGGRIEVESELGSGTTFSIYFPRIHGAVPEAEPSSSRERPPGGTESILVVEDDASVRTLVTTVLRTLGYTVVEAGDGLEALRVCDSRGEDLDLVLTDMIMPHMSGAELVAKLARSRPGLRVLFASGYTERVAQDRNALPPDAAFLDKPFSVNTLARKVRDVLDGTP